MLPPLRRLDPATIFLDLGFKFFEIFFYFLLFENFGYVYWIWWILISGIKFDVRLNIPLTKPEKSEEIGSFQSVHQLVIKFLIY